MGCASSKKRTTSLDDVTAAGDGVEKRKNGVQVTSKSPAGLGDASNAVQIPGAHTSFMAPDGIPFIDEDVVEDDVRTTSAKPADVNRNVTVVTVLQTQTTTTATTATTTPTTTTVDTVITTPSDTTVHVEQVVITTTTETHATVNGLEPVTDEEQQRAAVKIQAGIRGYRDRQRVKAMRASHEEEQQHQHQQQQESLTVETNDEPSAVHDGLDQHDSIQVKTDDIQMAHTPEMDRAAVKIQASYKGYKTRKSLGKI